MEDSAVAPPSFVEVLLASLPTTRRRMQAGYDPSGLPDFPPQLGPSGYTALWIGFVGNFLATLYMLRASLHSHSKNSRIYHYITLIVTFVCSMSYLTMVMGFMASKPLGPDFDFIWVHYADWVICTPLLLVDLSVLAGS